MSATEKRELRTAILLRRISCCECGIVFAIPEAVAKDRTHPECPDDDDDSAWIRCPNGHQFHFIAQTPKEPELSKRENRNVRCLQGQLVQEKHWREQLEAELAALKESQYPQPAGATSPVVT